MPEPNTKQFELQKAVAIALALATGLRKDPYRTIFDVWCGGPENRGEPCTLLVFIDDATSKLMQLRFVPSESTDTSTDRQP